MKIKSAAAHFRQLCDFLVQSASRCRLWLFRGSGRTQRGNSRREFRILVCLVSEVLLLGSDGDSVTSCLGMTCPEVSRPGRASVDVSLHFHGPSGLALKWKLYPRIPYPFPPVTTIVFRNQLFFVRDISAELKGRI